MEPKKIIGFWTLISLVMGNMIGAGVFSLPASLAHYGSISLMGWAFTALGSLLLALIFASLSQKIPQAGGPYAYCREGLGDFMGFQVAWTYWISMWVGSVATVVIIVGHLGLFIPALSETPLLSFACGLSIIWGLTGLNMLSFKGSGVFQIITTLLKLTPILAIIFWGLPQISFENFQAFNVSQDTNTYAFMATATLTMWTFLGLESATIPSNALIKNPQRFIPLATVLGTLCVGVLYMAAHTTILGLIPNEVLQKTPTAFAFAAEILFGKGGAILVALGAIIAALGSLNGYIFIQSHIPLTASQDKIFPPFFAKTTKEGVPIRAFLTTACIMSCVLWMNYDKSLVHQFTFLVTLATLASLATYFFSIIATVFIDRQRQVPFSLKTSVLYLLALGYTVWTIIGAGLEVFTYGSLLFLGSAPFFFLIRWRYNKSSS
ncbi:MAG: amino acid permease [Alphaproteobacteria bacterium]|nr:amino acid permease [Alphaproteobacteria bacterium]